MKIATTLVRILILAAAAFVASCRTAPTPATASVTRQELQPLQLIQRIPAPDVAGRIDHFTAYPKRRLLIFAALGNNSVEIVNTFEGKVVHSIKGLNEPQGVLYVPEFDKVFVANAGSGKVSVYDGKTYVLAGVLNWARNPIPIIFAGMRLPNEFLSVSWAASP